MIVDRLQRAGLYEGLLPALPRALEYLRAFDLSTPDGRHEIDGERVFALVSRYETGPATEKRFETHRRHVDVQWVASGRERLLHAPADGLEVQEPYDPERDVAFQHDPPFSSSILLQPGDFALLFPDDAHKPGCMAGGRDAVLKVVVKLRL